MSVLALPHVIALRLDGASSACLALMYALSLCVPIRISAYQHLGAQESWPSLQTVVQLCIAHLGERSERLRSLNVECFLGTHARRAKLCSQFEAAAPQNAGGTRACIFLVSAQCGGGGLRRGSEAHFKTSL